MLNEDLAYLAGVMRDGCVYVVDRHTYQTIIIQKNTEWLEKVVEPIIRRQFGLIGKMRSCNGVGRLVYNSKYLAGWLISNFGCRPNVAWNTPGCINENSCEHALMKAYVRGFFDAEGCISFWKARIKGKEYLQQRLSITQYGNGKSCESLEKLRWLLRNFDIHMGIIHMMKDDPRKFRLQTSDRKNILRFWAEIAPKHPDKVLKFEQFLSRMRGKFELSANPQGVPGLKQLEGRLRSSHPLNNA